MTDHPNFYENLKEAQMRLVNTIVLYDGEPYYVLAITDHKKDGIFRVYMDKMGQPEGMLHQNTHVPYDWHDEPGGMSKGDKLDEWLSKNEGKGILRKQMNSPLFNKFRPFPIGMCNNHGTVVYIERSPTRNTQQGLMPNMLSYYELSAVGSLITPRKGGNTPSLFGVPFYKTIKGDYPNPFLCAQKLNDPEIVDTSVAFHRDFAFVRGPVGLLFLAYKHNVIGYMPNSDFSKVTISPSFKHTKEVVQKLELFEDIKI